MPAIVLGALAAVCWASSAGAFCREVGATPPAGYDPAEAGACFAGVDDAGVPYPPLWWRTQCVGYSLQQNASIEVSLADARRVATQAFAAWSGAYCADAGGGPSIQADEFIPVQCDQVPSAGHNNPIIFRDHGWPYDSANALGFTTLTVVLSTGEIVGADIEVNTSSQHPILADVDGSVPNGAYDLASILTHEAGHFLGLAHSQDTTAVMYAFYHPGSTLLTPDDLDGICTLYPPDTSRSTAEGTIASSGCNPEPVLGFETQCGSLDASAGVIGSGPLGDGGADGGDPCTNGGLFSCAVGRGAAPAGAGLAACGLVALGLALRRTRRAGKGTGLAASLAFLVAGIAGMSRADASVSIAVLFDELVQRATAAALVTPIDRRAAWEDGRIVTYTHARVDRVVAGQLPGDVWLRSLGGAVEGIGQIVQGQPTFALGEGSLVFVRPAMQGTAVGPSSAFAVVEAAQGQYPVVAGDGRRPRLMLASDIGALVPPRTTGRLARDVLGNRGVDDAASEIAAVWRRK